jgi:hypothetical protein
MRRAHFKTNDSGLKGGLSSDPDEMSNSGAPNMISRMQQIDILSNASRRVFSCFSTKDNYGVQLPYKRPNGFSFDNRVLLVTIAKIKTIK